MIRLAVIQDAKELNRLNQEFNEIQEDLSEYIRHSLLNNQQEIVFVDEQEHHLTAMLCMQAKKSFCYRDYTIELTELYVEEQYRRNHIASLLIQEAIEYALLHYPCHKVELLTGDDNLIAQKVYEKLGFNQDGEYHYRKRIR